MDNIDYGIKIFSNTDPQAVETQMITWLEDIKRRKNVIIVSHETMQLERIDDNLFVITIGYKLIAS